MTVATARSPREFTVTLRQPHPRQAEFVSSDKKRIIIRAGRRSGKTVGIAVRAVQRFLAGRRILYAAPTQEQVDAFWYEVKRALVEPLDAGVYYKNESLHLIELAGTKQRIRAKTAWNADTLRGDYADTLILDEWQLMDEAAWGEVGVPMLLDNDGDAVFIYTPPSLRSRSVSKARDPLHAARMYKAALADTTGRWAAYHFTSLDNPYISPSALDTIAADMTALAYRQEILAEDVEDAPGALWKRTSFKYGEPPHAHDAQGVDIGRDMTRVVVGVDPAATSGATSAETGIIVAGRASDGLYYVLDDRSVRASPDGWARRAVQAYKDYRAGSIVPEVNNGGEMVIHTIRTVDSTVTVYAVHATRGKAIRAEPVAALSEQGKLIYVRPFPELEDQQCTWTPESGKSPDRLDALVWAVTALSAGVSGGAAHVIAGDRESRWR